MDTREGRVFAHPHTLHGFPGLLPGLAASGLSMAVSSQDNSRTFVATGTAAPVAINFPWADASDLIVQRLVAGADSADDGAPETLNSGYSIGGSGRATPPSSPTGFLTEINLIAGRTYRIERKTNVLQKYLPRMGIAGDASAQENQLDDMVMAQQDAALRTDDLQGRSWVVPRGETAGLLPSVVNRAGKVLGWDAGGLPVSITLDDSLDGSLRADLADSAEGAALVAFLQAGAGAVQRTAQAKARDVVSVMDFEGCDPTGATASTAAFQSALNTGKHVAIPDGLYKVSGLTQATAGQCIYGVGRPLIQKSANGLFLTSTANDFTCQNVVWDGQGAFSGAGILCTGDRAAFTNAGVRCMNGYALEMRGGQNQWMGTEDILYSADPAGGPLKIGDEGNPSLSLYNTIMGLKCSTSDGAVRIEKVGSTWFIGCQTGDVAMPFGSGASIIGGRVVGDLLMAGNFCQAIGVNISGDVTLGDGVNNIAEIVFDGSCKMSATKTLTINAGIRESVIHAAQLAPSVIIADNLTGTAQDIDNVFYGRPTVFVPRVGAPGIWVADGGAAINSGTLSVIYIRDGRFTEMQWTLQGAADTDWGDGTGEWQFGLPIKARNNGFSQYGSAWIGQATPYLGQFVVDGDGQYATVLLGSDAASPVRANRPAAWSDGARLRGGLRYLNA